MVADDIDRDDSITGYEVTGGDDRDEFEITNTNQLHFKEDPDFEDPTDSGSNNEYIVEVTATGGADTRARTVTQDNYRHRRGRRRTAGQTRSSHGEQRDGKQPDRDLDAPTNTGPDITNYHVQYRISGVHRLVLTLDPTLTRTITGLRSGTTYQIQVQAENDEGKGAWSNSVSGTTLTAPTVSSVAFTSTPASGQNNTYKLNDVIDVTATFSEAVTVTSTPQIDLTIGTTVRQADYKSGSTRPNSSSNTRCRPPTRTPTEPPSTPMASSSTAAASRTTPRQSMRIWCTTRRPINPPQGRWCCTIAYRCGSYRRRTNADL